MVKEEVKHRSDIKSMGELFRCWIHEHCNPAKSIKEIEKQMEKVKEKHKERMKEELEELKEEKEVLEEQRARERRKLKEYKGDIIKHLRKIYNAGGGGLRHNNISMANIDSFIGIIDNKEVFDDVEIRSEKKLKNAIWKTYKKEEWEDEDVLFEKIYERFVEESILLVK